MIDSAKKLKVLRTSIAHALNRLGPPDACDVQAPPDLRDLISRFIKAGGRYEQLLHLFAEADRPSISSGKKLWQGVGLPTPCSISFLGNLRRPRPRSAPRPTHAT